MSIHPVFLKKSVLVKKRCIHQKFPRNGKKMVKSTLVMKSLFVSCISCILFSSYIQATTSEQIEQQIKKLVTNGAVVLDDESGKKLISFNADKLFIPASIIKIVTSEVALDLLGRDYRFRTEFYQNAQNDLAIKGWGDPYLISEELEMIALELQKKGVTRIRQLFIDNSNFDQTITIPGISKTSNPYDAINGALVTNFNTLNLKKDTQGKIYSAEEVTPLTPLAIIKGKYIKIGSSERINLSVNRNECLQYAGELFIAMFKKKGMEIENETIGYTKSESSWNLLYTHYNTKDIVSVVRGLQKYSNNFIANQLFLTVGAQKLGYPASLEKGKNVFNEYITSTLKIPSDQLVMFEGSGISRDNRVTPDIMMHFLKVRPELAKLLPLKHGALVKSGTLTGVYNYAGYIQTPTGLRPFVIMLNQSANNRDRILDLLVEYCNLLK